MELLDRYLEAVKKHLPWQGRDDILAELRANLEAQLEDKETELGRPLTKEEAQEWVKQIGPPILMAARYQKHQYLIGPAVFPVYWYVLRLALAWCAVIYAIAKALEIAAQGLGASAALSAVLNLPWVLLIDAAIVTLVFAVIELSGTRFPGEIAQIRQLTSSWSPMDLPPVGGCGAESANKPWSFAKALSEVIFGYVFFAWLLLVPHYPYLMFGPGAWYLASLPYKLAHAWWPFYWWVVIINGLELAWKTVDLWCGAWGKRKLWRRWATHTLSLIPLGILLAAPGHELFLAKNPAANGATLAAANKGLHTALMISVAVVVLQLVWNAGKAGVVSYRGRVAAIR